MPAVPEYFFEEDADEGLMNRFQSEPADDNILNAPKLMTLSAGNAEFTRAEQLAKKIALRLELLTDKGSYTPWHTPFEASDMPFYPGMAANDSLLDKVKGTIAGLRSSYPEETFHPSGPVDSSPPGLHPVSEQYIATVITPVPRKSSLAERTPTQTVYPFVPSSERMHLNFEPSGDLSARPSGQPVSQARIGSLSHLSGSPLITSNNIPAGKALAASPSSLFEPPQVSSGAVLARKADTTPVSLPEEFPLFHRDEITDMTSVTSQYSESLVPQPPLDKTLGFHQTSPLHWSAGHIPPSLTGEAISQDMGEPVKAPASTIKNSPFGGYNRGMEVGLALAPIGRQRENISPATSSAVSTGQERELEAVDETTAALDPEALASEVYSILKRRLIVERERTTSIVA